MVYAGETSIGSISGGDIAGAGRFQYLRSSPRTIRTLAVNRNEDLAVPDVPLKTSSFEVENSQPAEGSCNSSRNAHRFCSRKRSDDRAGGKERPCARNGQ